MEDSASRGTQNVVSRYFDLSAEIESAKASRNYAAAVRAARETYGLLLDVVREWKRQYGSFDIATSHAVHTAPTLMAVLEDHEGIRELRATLEGVAELRAWLPAADQAEEDLIMVPRIVAAVRASPAVIQSSLKSILGCAQGSRISQLASWLEKAGRIRRVKKGSSYQLYVSEYVAIPGAPPQTTMTRASHPARSRKARSPKKARHLDFSGLPIVRLPMAPPAWEERQAREATAAAGETTRSNTTTRGRSKEPAFLVEGADWSLGREEKLAPNDRPDPSFRDVLHTGRYTYWVDAKGKREGFEYADAVIQVTDRAGRRVAERGLAHDVYRADVAPLGTGVLFLSRGGVLHGYTNDLTLFLEERLFDLAEYQAQADRLGIDARELKNHVRCVALSDDRTRYLVTIVDEAWCVDAATGDVVWGLRMPTKEGWTRHIAERSERAGTSAEVEAALRLMELELPASPDDLVRQYRKLAMRWHPDRNPGDANATARFQHLRAAVELLTGADLSSLSGREAESVTYEQMLSTRRVTVNIPGSGGRNQSLSLDLTASLLVGEKHAADWIYAANLGHDGRAFLAGYSGKTVVVSAHGVPELVYDIGAVPRHIVAAGDRLHVLTDTRLYVLSKDRLEALVDVYGTSDVVVADHGFALFEPKALTWFSSAGRHIGTVRSRDPLRRAFSTSEGLVVETRQHRALVVGPPAWWD
jgi:hypothetical protein